MNIAKMAEPHCNTSKFFSLPCAPPLPVGCWLPGILLRLWLLFELTTARAAQVRAWRRHYVLIIIFNYLLRTTRACRNSESWTRTTLHCADCFSFALSAPRAFIHLLRAALLHTSRTGPIKLLAQLYRNAHVDKWAMIYWITRSKPRWWLSRALCFPMSLQLRRLWQVYILLKCRGQSLVFFCFKLLVKRNRIFWQCLLHMFK